MKLFRFRDPSPFLHWQSTNDLTEAMNKRQRTGKRSEFFHENEKTKTKTDSLWPRVLWFRDKQLSYNELICQPIIYKLSYSPQGAFKTTGTRKTLSVSRLRWITRRNSSEMNVFGRSSVYIIAVVAVASLKTNEGNVDNLYPWLHGLYIYNTQTDWRTVSKPSKNVAFNNFQ